MLKKPEYTPGCAPEKSRTLCWYDFGVQYCQDVTAEKDGGSGCLCPCMETLALDDALDVLDAMLVDLSSVTPERLGRKNGSAR